MIMCRILFNLGKDQIQFQIGAEPYLFTLSECEFWSIMHAIQKHQLNFTGRASRSDSVYYCANKLILQRRGKPIYLDSRIYKDIANNLDAVLESALHSSVIVTSAKDTSFLLYTGDTLSLLVDSELMLCIGCNTIAHLIEKRKVIMYFEDSPELQEIIVNRNARILREVIIGNREGFDDVSYLCLVKNQFHNSLLLCTADRLVYVDYPEFMFGYTEISKFKNRLYKGDFYGQN